MNFIKKNIKLIIGFIVGAIVASSVTVYAYSYLASDIKYTKEEKDGTETEIDVEQALDELYRNKDTVYETGEFDQYVAAYSNYASVTLNLSKTYTAQDNARLVLTSITNPNAMYCSINGKIVGNKVQFVLLNFAGDGSYSKTYHVEYSIVRCDE